MTESEKLKLEFEKKKQELQSSCKHEELSNWIDVLRHLEEWWAVGHPTGFAVKLCKRCGKLINKRTSCNTCGKPIQDDEIFRGDGSSWDIPAGGNFCKECFDKGKKHPSNYKKILQDLKEVKRTWV